MKSLQQLTVMCLCKLGGSVWRLRCVHTHPSQKSNRDSFIIDRKPLYAYKCITARAVWVFWEAFVAQSYPLAFSLAIAHPCSLTVMLCWQTTALSCWFKALVWFTQFTAKKKRVYPAAIVTITSVKFLPFICIILTIIFFKKIWNNHVKMLTWATTPTWISILISLLFALGVRWRIRGRGRRRRGSILASGSGVELIAAKRNTPFLPPLLGILGQVNSDDFKQKVRHSCSSKEKLFI